MLQHFNMCKCMFTHMLSLILMSIKYEARSCSQNLSTVIVAASQCVLGWTVMQSQYCTLPPAALSQNHHNLQAEKMVVDCRFDLSRRIIK